MWTRTRCLLACSMVPQPTKLPRAPLHNMYFSSYFFFTLVLFRPLVISLTKSNKPIFLYYDCTLSLLLRVKYYQFMAMKQN
jgi:hypothetical protein